MTARLFLVFWLLAVGSGLVGFLEGRKGDSADRGDFEKRFATADSVARSVESEARRRHDLAGAERKQAAETLSSEINLKETDAFGDPVVGQATTHAAPGDIRVEPGEFKVIGDLGISGGAKTIGSWRVRLTNVSSLDFRGKALVDLVSSEGLSLHRGEAHVYLGPHETAHAYGQVVIDDADLRRIRKVVAAVCPASECP